MSDGADTRGELDELDDLDLTPEAADAVRGGVRIGETGGEDEGDPPQGLR